MKYIALFLCSLLMLPSSEVPSEWLGKWEGYLYIERNAEVVDSVQMKMEITRVYEDLYNWKTTYWGTEKTIVKDYMLYPDTTRENRFILDENNGILLYVDLIGNSLISNFDVAEQNFITRHTLLSANDMEMDFLIFKNTEKDILSSGGQNDSIPEVHAFPFSTKQYAKLKKKINPLHQKIKPVKSNKVKKTPVKK